MEKKDYKEAITPNCGGPDLGGLNNLFLIADRLSHSISNHLSVCFGLVNDAVRGHLLDEVDLKNLTHAVRSIEQVLETVRIIACKPTFSQQAIELRSFLDQEVLSLWKQTGVSEEIKIVIGEQVDKKIIGDIKLLSKAFVCIFNYMSCFVLKAEIKSALANDLTLSFTCNDNFELFRNTKTLDSLIEIDTRPQTLGLVFAREVFRIHGWRPTEILSDGSQVCFSIRFT